jgi:hypothetical protein
MPAESAEVVSNSAAKKWYLDRAGYNFDDNENPNINVIFDEVRWITQASHLRRDVSTLKLKT